MKTFSSKYALISVRQNIKKKLEQNLIRKEVHYFVIDPMSPF